MGENGRDLKVIIAERLLDGASNEVIHNAAVLIKGSTISWVGPEKHLRMPEGGETRIVRVGHLRRRWHLGLIEL